MKYYTIDKRNKTVILDFPFDREIVSVIKECSNISHWNSELKHWIIPIDSHSIANVLNFIKDYNFTLKPTKEELEVKYDYSLNAETMAKLKQICINRGFTYTPRDYQLEALYHSMKYGSLLNGDDCGLGKTFEAIMYAEVTDSFPCLVVAPSSVKYNWAEKWAEIVGSKRSISVIESKETKKNTRRWDTDVVIINYDIIGKKKGKGATANFPELLETKWKMTIFDEGHFLKESKSQRSVVARLITKKSDMKINLLTGTAIMSRPSELWNLLKLIKKDHLIADNWKQYILRYCGAYKTKYGEVYTGATNTLELNKKLRENCYIRREKREVLKDLPDVEKFIFNTPVTNIKDIDRATYSLYEYLLDTKGEEVADSAMEAEQLVALNVLRKLAIDGKVKAIEQFLKDWKTGGEKLVIFGLHREALEYLSEKFKSKLIAGGITAMKKQEIIKDWISNDEPLLFANMLSAGTGVDGLQKVCSNMLIIELPWRPSDLTQVIGRLDRSGQNLPSTVRFMLNFDTIDKQMWEMLEEKEQVTEAVNKGIDISQSNSGMKIVMKKIFNLKNTKL